MIKEEAEGQTYCACAGCAKTISAEEIYRIFGIPYCNECANSAVRLERERILLRQENAELKDLLKWCWEEFVNHGECYDCHEGERYTDYEHYIGDMPDCYSCQQYNKSKKIVEGK